MFGWGVAPIPLLSLLFTLPLSLGTETLYPRVVSCDSPSASYPGGLDSSSDGPIDKSTFSGLWFSLAPPPTAEHSSQPLTSPDGDFVDGGIASEIRRRYWVEDEAFAVGGDSVIHRGALVNLNPPYPVAIKVINLQGGGSAGYEEGRILADLCHPNIVRLVEYVQDGGRQYLVLELIDGITLAQLFQAGIPVSPPQVLVIMQQIMRAMAHYQAKGITHNDLHVGNVMIQAKTGRIKIIDFGDATRSGNYLHDLQWLKQLLSTLHAGEDGASEGVGEARERGACLMAVLRRLLACVGESAGRIPPWVLEHEVFKLTTAEEESLAELVHMTRLDDFPFRLGRLCINDGQRYQLGHLADDLTTKFDIELVSRMGGGRGQDQDIVRMLTELSNCASHSELFSPVAIPQTNLDVAIIRPLEVASRHQYYWLIFSHGPRGGALGNIGETGGGGKGDDDDNDDDGSGDGDTDSISPVSLFRAAIMAIKLLYTHGLSLVGGSTFPSSSLSGRGEEFISKMGALLVVSKETCSGPGTPTLNSRLRPCLGARLNGHSVRLTGGTGDAIAIQRDLLFLATWGRALVKSREGVSTAQQRELIVQTVGGLERAAYGQSPGGRAIDDAIAHLAVS